MAEAASATQPDRAEVPRTRGRGRTRPIEDLTLTDAQKQEAKEEMARQDEKSTKTNYHKAKKRKLMKIVKYLDQNNGERFLREQPQTEEWKYPKVLDVHKVEAEEELFFEEFFSTFLGSMKHKTLKFKGTDTPQKVRHATIKKYCTALNSRWGELFRKVPYK